MQMRVVLANLTVMLDHRSGLGCILTSISVASSLYVHISAREVFDPDRLS